MRGHGVRRSALNALECRHHLPRGRNGIREQGGVGSFSRRRGGSRFRSQMAQSMQKGDEAGRDHLGVGHTAHHLLRWLRDAEAWLQDIE